MFCPKCATQNLEGASFCRSCGANISLIPQALSGQMQQQPEVDEDQGLCRTRRGRVLTLDQAFKNIFMGIAFLIVSIALSRTIGAGWWFWMLLPAFSLMGTGIAQYMRLREQDRREVFAKPPAAKMFANRTGSPLQRDLTARHTGELMAPAPSVTEGTTRHLGVEARTRHFEAEQK
ncbi:MAG: hypothetical protein DMF69_12500 [Acidobacteria bacterium]|nr:MAG: hypothetical protein DMF69_12500 [Acidobacteriota bacterium]